MKSVLISIQPKWCELIANGKKTVEVRKTRPKRDTPFKVYIYCTHSGTTLKEKFKNIYTDFSGKVIGEFVCDRIDHYEMEGYDKSDTIYQNIRRIEGDEEYDNFSWVMEVSNDMSEIEISNSKLLKQSCLSFGDIGKYVVGNKEFGFYDFYGWHISNLVIYDKPKDLSEFINYGRCSYGGLVDCKKCEEHTCLKRPPQSWCYVEGDGSDA